MITLSILVHNQLDVTKRCIDSLFLTIPDNDVKIIVTDNASEKDMVGYLKKLEKDHENVTYIRNNENVGFGIAHNEAFKLCDTEYFSVLNNDLIFLTKDWHLKFIDELKRNPKVAQVGPKQMFGHLNNDAMGGIRKSNKMPPDYIEGSCFVMRSKDIRDLDILFEDKYIYFMYSEDADLSLRLRAKGFILKELENNVVNIMHLHNQTTAVTKGIDFDKINRTNREFMKDRWRNFLRYRNFSNPINILIRRAGAIGDVLCVEPITRELKRKYPHSKIFLSTNCEMAFEHNMDDIYDIGPESKLGRARYDIIINLDDGYERNPLDHILDVYARISQVKLDEDKRIPIFKKSLKWSPNEDEKIITVCTEGSWDSRTWDLEKWEKVLKKLTKEGYKIVEVGRNPAHYTGIGENCYGKLSLLETAELIAKSTFYLGVDGLLMHVAQSVGTPSIIVFGCTCPNYRVHDWPKIKALWLDQDELECAGCHHWKTAPRYHTSCDRKSILCLEKIEVNDVINAVHRKRGWNKPTSELKTVNRKKMIEAGYEPIDKDVMSVDDICYSANHIFSCRSISNPIPLRPNIPILQNVKNKRNVEVHGLNLMFGTYHQTIGEERFLFEFFDKQNCSIAKEQINIFNIFDNSWKKIKFRTPIRISNDFKISIRRLNHSKNNIAIYIDRTIGGSEILISDKKITGSITMEIL